MRKYTDDNEIMPYSLQWKSWYELGERMRLFLADLMFQGEYASGYSKAFVEYWIKKWNAKFTENGAMEALQRVLFMGKEYESERYNIRSFQPELLEQEMQADKRSLEEMRASDKPELPDANEGGGPPPAKKARME